MTMKAIKTRLNKQLGIISESDQYHFELLLNSWEIYLQAQAEIKKIGIVVNTNGRWFVNPSCNVRNESWKQIVTLTKLFGISPIARDGNAVAEEDDAIAGML